MRTAFANYLVEQGCVDDESARAAAAAAQDFREAIGALAFRYDLMTPAQVEEILGHLTPARRFGEVAVAMKYLTQEQVNCLLSIQELEEVLEIGGNLMLGGKLTREAFVSQLKQFMDQYQEAEPAHAIRAV